MPLKRIANSFVKMVQPRLRRKQSPAAPQRASMIHVIILDGTMSSLELGEETNAGLTYGLLSDMGANVSVFYEAGVQWNAWRNAPDVLMGKGINRQIRRAYSYLCSRYRPGDKIFLFGYSRGAFAVRSLAGVIDQVGLLRPEHATERNIQLAYRHYQTPPGGEIAAKFHNAYCHPSCPIEMIGAWDTVKALGNRLPGFWRLAEEKHSFHNHELGGSVRRGYQALALNESRQVFEPILWDSRCAKPWQQIEQVWFRGAHADIGGQVNLCPAARPLSNIPLVWMLNLAEANGLPLPQGWRRKFPQDVEAPSVGTWRGWGKMFLLRRARQVGLDPSERIHESVQVEEASQEFQTAV